MLYAYINSRHPSPLISPLAYLPSLISPLGYLRITARSLSATRKGPVRAHHHLSLVASQVMGEPVEPKFHREGPQGEENKGGR